MITLAPPDAASPASAFRRKLMLGVAVLVLLAVGVGLLAVLTTNDDVANRDFVEYWAAGQQLVRGANPYGADPIFTIERSAGWQGPRPIVMFNPPSALFLTLPLGTVRLRIGYLLWSVFLIGAWLGSIHLLWIMNGRARNALHFIGYFFAPAMACFLAGQTSTFVLLGLTLFLYFHSTRPLLAGASLLLCALKPHLLLPFGAALLAWAVARRAWRILAGAAGALVITGILPLFWDLSVYRQYAAMSRTSGVQAAFIPTWSELLRIAVNPAAFWIQFLPALVGCLWALWYFYRRRGEWDWRARGPLLILVSFLLAPYAWAFDAVILLPALFFAAYRSRPGALAVLFVLLAADGVQLLLGVSSFSPWNLWPSVAWLAWYLWTLRLGSSPAPVPAAA